MQNLTKGKFDFLPCEILNFVQENAKGILFHRVNFCNLHFAMFVFTNSASWRMEVQKSVVFWRGENNRR